MVGAIVLSPIDTASLQQAVVGSTQRVVVARARAPRDAAVQCCLEYLGSYIRSLSSRGGLGRPYSSRRVYFRKLHHAWRMRRSTSLDRS